MKKWNIILVSLVMLNLQASDSGRSSGLSLEEQSPLPSAFDGAASATPEDEGRGESPIDFLLVLATAAVAKQQNPETSIEFPAEVPKNKFICEWPGCGKMLFKKSKNDHMNAHAGIEPYQCDRCDKRFTYNNMIKIHGIAKHGDPKPHGCSFCEKIFSTSTSRYQHERIHTGEKPYLCSLPNCGKRFSQSGNCNRHEARHKKTL